MPPDLDRLPARRQQPPPERQSLCRRYADELRIRLQDVVVRSKFRLNGAVFYEKWNQLQFGLSPVGSAGVTNIYNAGDARVYGAEMDFNLRLGGAHAFGRWHLYRCSVDHRFLLV